MILTLTQDSVINVNLDNLHPNDSLIKNFIKDFCKIAIYKKQYPEIVSLAFYFRKYNFSLDELYVPRGICLHFAPSNVDSIFVYSWFTSLLCGNNNIIRVSSKRSKVTEEIISIIDFLFEQQKYTSIKERNIIVSYEKDNKINDYLSQLCDVRLIFGGDETINTIKQSKTKPNCKDLCFYDRFSYTVINENEYMKLNDNKKDELVLSYYNDIFLFNQLACSSSKLLFWHGNNISDFYKRLEKCSCKYNIDLSLLMNKENYCYENIINNDCKYIRINSRLSILETSNINRNHCGGGVLFVMLINDLNDINAFIHKKDQTLGYFGYSKDQLKAFALQVNGKGIDRIVSIGKQNLFDRYWDGFDLVRELMKVVYID